MEDYLTRCRDSLPRALAANAEVVLHVNCDELRMQHVETAANTVGHVLLALVQTIILHHVVVQLCLHLLLLVVYDKSFGGTSGEVELVAAVELTHVADGIEGNDREPLFSILSVDVMHAAIDLRNSEPALIIEVIGHTHERQSLLHDGRHLRESMAGENSQVLVRRRLIDE